MKGDDVNMETTKSIKEQIDELEIVGVPGDDRPDGTYLGTPYELQVKRGDKVYVYQRKSEHELTAVEVPKGMQAEIERMARRMLEFADDLGVEHIQMYAYNKRDKYGPTIGCRINKNRKTMRQEVFWKRLGEVE